MNSRTALVTGASRGIGRSCAFALAKAGARVAVAARSEAVIEELAAELRAVGSESFAVALDVADPASIKNAAERTAAAFGRIDILVNNAGIVRDGLAMRMKKDDWDAVLAANLTGAFLMIQHVLPAMMRNRWGRIINISSVVGETGNAGQANYAASKAGLIGMTKSIAQEMASRNITVNAVAPGYIATAMTESLPGDVKEKMAAAIPLRRVGTPEEVASAVRFLASEEASYITGHTLDVNGGLHM